MSKYLDILKRVRNGTATDEETILFKDEIEKHEAIEEYLADEFDKVELPSQDTADLRVGKRIARKVRLKIIGTVLISLLVIGVLYIATVYICNNYFYNPNQGVAEVYGGDGTAQRYVGI